MTYLLDTCVLSELRRRDADAGIRSWTLSVDEAHLYLSVVALAEIQKGISKLPEGVKRTGLQVWLDEELPARFSGRILPVNEDTERPITVELGTNVLAGTRSATGP